MHTGDLATIDAEGYCNIVGRIKDMVIRGGENIYPREVEEFLYAHPDVQDVQCFGVPDTKFGEELCAAIILQARVPTPTRRRSAPSARARSPTTRCRATSASSTSFPTTVTGKVQKFVLRAETATELGLAEERTA